ncbi:restriction system protein [Ruminococcus albus]|uniref:Restriction system protein n=2 Tax=Ruminococcus albus TaxID=1264 RepID=A0A1I1ELV7_RUMAL|nr:restriction system protein [Ruminococcus albus]
MFLGISIIRHFGRLTLKKLDLMDGHEFEYACANILKANGFKDIEVTKCSGDFGVDIIAVKKHRRYAVQCKRYDKKLNNSAIQEVIGGLAYYGCEVGAVMTNSYFTAAARKLAEVNSVELWDRDILEKMLRKRGIKDTSRKSNDILDMPPESYCAQTVEEFFAEQGIAVETAGTEYLEDTCELLIEIVPETGVRISDIRNLTQKLANHGGWEYVTCVFPSHTPGTVGLEIPLEMDNSEKD